MAMTTRSNNVFKVSRRPRVASRWRSSLRVQSAKLAVPPVEDLDYIKFAEIVNGRCAMQGFIWGSVKEAMTHNTIMEQLVTKTSDGNFDINAMGALEFSVIVFLVTLGTVFTSVVKDASGYSSETFTTDAEMTNSRLAMVGFFILSMTHFY